MWWSSIDFNSRPYNRSVLPFCLWLHHYYNYFSLDVGPVSVTILWNMLCSVHTAETEFVIFIIIYSAQLHILDCLQNFRLPLCPQVSAIIQMKQIFRCTIKSCFPAGLSRITFFVKSNARVATRLMQVSRSTALYVIGSDSAVVVVTASAAVT